MNLPKNITNLLVWLVYKAPKKINTVVWRLTKFVNNELSFTVNLRLIFVPLFGDYTFIGRIIGICSRIIFIVVGFFFIGILCLLTIGLPLAWYVLPLIMIYFLGIWSVPVFAGGILYLIYVNLDTPQVRVNAAETGSELECFRPQTKNSYLNIQSKSVYSVFKFLKSPQISALLYRSELLNKDFEDKISKSANIDYGLIEKKAYQYAVDHKTRYVEDEHLFLAVLASISNIDTVLSTFGTDLSVLEKTVRWIVENRESLAKLYFWQEDYEMPPIAGFGHGLTGRITPSLDAISTDFTALAKKGRLKNIIGREKEVEKIATYLGGSNENILLLGEPGCGKSSLVMGIAHKIMHGTKYKTLQNKRIVSLEMGALIAGARSSGEIADKLKRAMDDVRGSGDIILFIDEIHTLVGSIHEGEGFSTVFSVLEPYLSSNDIQFVGATNIENYRKYIEPVQTFASLFEVIDIPESSETDTLEILKYISGLQQKKFNVVITMPSLLKILKLSNKLIHDRVNPDKAIDVLIRACTEEKEKDSYITSDDIERVISDMTHIPVTAVSEDESQRLLKIEDEMKKRVIGQDHAIKKISSALKRARVGIRDESKPIASFLFVGTTGVGKTETAKTLSSVYFGDKNAMIRLDMSEYQTADSIDKLIGTSDGKTKGILTEAVRTKPFTLILLDEIEKAHSQIILTFLQVLDDARLTDSSGRTIDFTNSIIIATSNAGTKEIQAITEKGGTFKEIEESAIAIVRKQFAPEFLNRFTGIMVYKPLSIEDVKKIAYILLENVRKIAEDKDIKLSFTDELIHRIVEKGYNPEWGARPMARVVEEYIETYIADKILANEYKPGDSVTLGIEVFEKEDALIEK